MKRQANGDKTIQVERTKVESKENRKETKTEFKAKAKKDGKL